MRRIILLALLATACGKQEFDIGLNVGAAGADVGRMAASEIRQSRAAKDRRVDVRVAAVKAVARGEATPQLLRASLDSIADSENVGVIISRFLDEQSLAAAQTYSSKGVPVLATTPLPPGTTSPNGPLFALVPNYIKQARFLAEQAGTEDRIAIIHIKDYYGNTLAAALTEALRARGLSVMETRTYLQSWDEPRMVALGSELEKTRDPSLVYFLGRAPSLELVWQPFRDAAKTIRVLGSDLVESTAVFDNPEGRFTGLRYVRYADPQAKETRMKDLHDRYAMWIGRGEMTGEAVLIYDGMMMTAEALRSGARTRQEIRQYFASLGRSRPPFNGVGGPISFGDDGEVVRKFELAEVTNQGIVKAEP